MKIQLSDLSVLLVEPSKMQARALSRLLNARSVQEIEIVSTGHEAFEIIQSRAPDLVISSLYLDDMTGSDLVRAMRREEALMRVPFMLISSETRFEPLDPIRQAGVVSLISKLDVEAGLDSALQATLKYLEPDELNLGDLDPEDVRVGLVDDSRMARNHMRRTLNDFGFQQIFEAEDGAQGQHLISEQNLDILITDLHMPHLDGAELSNWVRKDSNQPELGIIAVTSDDEPEQTQRVLQSGANAVCIKPFDLNHLRNLLTELLR